MITVLLFLLSGEAQACMNFTPMSEAVKAIALQPGAGAKSCKDLPQEKCLCFDGVDWEISVIRDVEEDDTSRPIFAKAEKITPCVTEEFCQKLIETKIENVSAPSPSPSPAPSRAPSNPALIRATEIITYCQDFPGYLAFYRKTVNPLLPFEAYCTRVTGYEQMTVTKILEDADKKAAKVARLAAEAAAKATRRQAVADAKARLKLANPTDAATLRQSVLDLIKVLDLDL